MARGEDKPEKPTQAEVERAEARAAERARREERRRKRAEKKAGAKDGAEKKDGARKKDSSAKKDGPGWRERLAAAGDRVKKAAEAKSGEGKPAAVKAEESRSEVVQRRVAAVVIVLVAVVVIMWVTDAAPFFDDTSEEERVADTVERFFAAYRDGDHEEMCDLFSPDVKQTIEAAGVTEGKGEDPESCAQIIAARVGTPGEDEQISVKVDEVRVSGPRAIANLVLKTPDSARRQIEAVELELGPDGWLLTSPVITS